MNEAAGRELERPLHGPRSRRRPWNSLGPGLIAGASDDDPSGIATYAQAGAQFGFQLSWTLLVSYPMMVTVQAISARIGRTTGRGIAGNLRLHSPGWLLQSIVGLILIANTLNIGADLGAMAQASRLITPGLPAWVYIVLYAAVCLIGQIQFAHSRYVAILKWLTLSLLAYFAVLGFVSIPWSSFFRGLLIPGLAADRKFWLMVVAILGTTISPYLFFWQATQEVEDMKASPQREPLRQRPSQGPDALARIRWDTLAGMAFSNLVALAILVASGATLATHGVHDVQSAAQAAAALEPLAGPLASLTFALGIVGTGLLSVPVLAGSAAHALGEARGWPVGLTKRLSKAKGFYATLCAATLVGAAANGLKLNPVTALVWVAVINGIVAVPVMAAIMLMAASRRVMGSFRISAGWMIGGWVTTAVMGLAAIAFLLATVLS